MDGRAQPAQIAGLLVALAMKGERPAEIVGLARTMRGARDAAVADVAPVFDTCGTGGDRRAHVQRLDGRGARARGVRRPRREARQPIGVEPVRQRRSVRGARRRTSTRRAGGRRALSRRGRHRLLLRADVSSVDAACRADAAGARRPHGVQPARAADEPGGRVAAARRRAAAGADRAGRAVARAARRRARVGRARRDGLDEISTTGYTKVSECRDGAVNTFYRAPGGCRAAARRRPRRCAAAMPPRTPRLRARVLAGERGARARHRAAQRRRVAARSPARSTSIRGRPGDGGRGDRQRPRRRRARQLARVSTETGGRDVMTTPATPICSRRSSPPRGGSSQVRERERADRRAASGAARLARRAAGRGVRARAARAPAPRVIAECKRRSPSRGILRHDYDPAAHRARRTRRPARRRSPC